ncbi:hypothetical protein KI387_005676, partial [Taxus chinensis]
HKFRRCSRRAQIWKRGKGSCFKASPYFTKRHDCLFFIIIFRGGMLQISIRTKHAALVIIAVLKGAVTLIISPNI